MQITVLTWNIHKCTGGLDRRCDPARTARVIKDSAADVVLLQEVAQDGTWYRSERQADVLGDLLGLPHRSFFVNVRFGRRRGAYGNAVLSRFPMASTTNIDLTLAGRKARSVLHAELRIPVDHGVRTLHVFDLHLGLRERERHAQLQRFLAADPFRGLRRRTPVVVAGDFNDVWGTLGRNLLSTSGFRGAARALRTFPAWAPLRALDGFYVRGSADLLQLRTAPGIAARTASDHLPLIARLELRQ